MSSDLHALIARARACTAAGDHTGAERAWSAAARSGSVEALVRLAELARVRRRSDVALRRIARARRAGAEGDELGLLEGVCHLEAAERPGICTERRLAHLEAALERLEAVLARHPHAPDVLGARGNALRKLGRHAAAVASLRAALERAPEHAEQWSNLGLALRDAGDDAAALDAFARAVSLRPDHSALRRNLGNAKLRVGRTDEALMAAEDALRDALALDPDDVDARVDLATCLAALGRPHEAREALELAHHLAPDHPEARFNLALRCLADGAWRRGWALYEARRELPGFPVARLPHPDWDGTPRPHGHLLITDEQGLGDTVQFCRLVPLAALTFRGRVTLAVHPRLVSLCTGLPGVTRIIARHPAFGLDPDVTDHAPLLSLPRLLELCPETVPAREGHLRADAARTQRWSCWLDSAARPGALRVGIAWQGNPSYALDRHRSVPLSAFAPLARHADVQLVSLQAGAAAEQLAGCGFDVLALPEDADRDGAFVDTAGLIAGGLDLVVSTDTSVLHVAASLGAPTWAVLGARCDWRWSGTTDRGEASPWYAHLRLFRQRIAGEWGETFARLDDALAQEREQRSWQPNSTPSAKARRSASTSVLAS